MYLITTSSWGHSCASGPAMKRLLRVMKLTIFFLTVVLLQLSAEGYSQRVTISAKDESLEKVFRSIRKQTGYQFLYNNQMLDNAPRVTLQLTNATLEETLESCLKDQVLSYSIVGKTI